MSDTIEAIKPDEIIALLDKRYTLHYVDYNDDLREQLELVQKCVHANNWEALDEKIWDWFIDDHSGLDYVVDELNKTICKKFFIEESEASELIQQHWDTLREHIEDRDDSDILHDLLRNTGDQTFFYSTGIEIGDYYQPMKERIHDVKKALKIKQSDKSYDKEIEDMCGMAGYGGALVIYFYDSISDYIQVKDNSYIHFDGFHVAIINVGNGSGGDTELGHSFKLPYNPNQLYLCRTIKYSYTFSVCGMSADWCKSTDVSFTNVKRKYVKEFEKTQLQIDLERDARYKATWNNGKGTCTPGDMDINRHKSAPYVNEFPCGNRCAKCGTFWID